MTSRKLRKVNLLFCLVLMSTPHLAGAAQLPLHTSGNKIYTNDNKVWAGHGVNLHDMSDCNACASVDTTVMVPEIKRRMNAAIGQWGADFIRLIMDPQGTAISNPNYIPGIVSLVANANNMNVPVLLSLYLDTSLDPNWVPTTATATLWGQIVTSVGSYPNVMFGVANEPRDSSGAINDCSVAANSWDDYVRGRMNLVVSQIRQTEQTMGYMSHIVAVQGTRNWARCLQYYVSNPLQWTNIGYETHMYDETKFFDLESFSAASTLPVIIGELGPCVNPNAGLSAAYAAISRAEAAHIPYAAWAFTERCSGNGATGPSCNLIKDENPPSGCSINAPIFPTEEPWGKAMYNTHLRGLVPAPLPSVL